MTTTPPLDLDEIEAVFDAAAETGARIDLATGRRLLAEVRRQRDLITKLEPDAAFLAALEAAGVDNWEGYDDALERG